jgi:lipid-A-disaccharide synthase
MKIFITAGEASGDKLGAALMAGLRTVLPDTELTFVGVGGPLMEAEGLQSLFPMDEISIMGIGEILKEYRHLKRRIRQTAEAAIAMQPDVMITIDLPEFSLRVARLVKAASTIRTVHYVAPTVWAWRPGRAAKMAAHIDHVLALLPFEPPYMEAAGMRCDFVGHPVVTDPVASDEDVAAFYGTSEVNPDAPKILVLPGSRRSEVSRLMPIFGDVVNRLAAQRNDLQFIVPAAPNLLPMVQELSKGWNATPTILSPDMPNSASVKRGAFRAADLALAASGTVSLELAAVSTPMVVAYDMSWLSRQIIGRMLRVDTVNLVNLVAESRTIPEFVGNACRPEDIAPAVLEVLSHPDAQTEAMAKTMERLGLGGPHPGERAARAVLDGIAAANTRH